MKNFAYLHFLLLSVLLFGCDAGVESTRGFSLPKGDAEAGKSVFLNKQCLACHSMKGYEAEIETIPSEIEKRVPIGGESMRITSYAELVTSIINPSHKISRGMRPYNQDEEGSSTMRNYNQELTVQELIDIVAYLQPQYKLKPYQYTNYQNYRI